MENQRCGKVKRFDPIEPSFDVYRSMIKSIYKRIKSISHLRVTQMKCTPAFMSVYVLARRKISIYIYDDIYMHARITRTYARIYKYTCA